MTSIFFFNWKHSFIFYSYKLISVFVSKSFLAFLNFFLIIYCLLYCFSRFIILFLFLFLFIIFLISSIILGKVNPGENQKIIFSVRPATPTKIAETFSIKIAHFENVFVTCYCLGVFPCVVATLPRQKRTGNITIYII